MRKRHHYDLVKTHPRVAQDAITAMVGQIASLGLERLRDPLWRNWLLQVGAIDQEYHARLEEGAR